MPAPEAQDIAMNLASAGIGGGLTAWVARMLLKNMIQRFEEMAKAMNAMKEALAGMAVEIRGFSRVEVDMKEVRTVCLDLRERVSYLEAKAEQRPN